MLNRARIFLHIGWPKTGTTAIQHFCHHNRDLLLSSGLDYTPIGLFLESCAHHVLSHKWGIGWIEPAFFSETPDEAWSSLAQHFKGGSEPLLVSSEQFAEHFAEPSGIEILNYIRETFHPSKITIIAYVRSQVEMVESLFRQRIKTGHFSGSFEDFLRSPQPLLDYKGTFSRIADVFGSDSIVVRLYDRRCWPAGDLIADFLSACGLRVPGGSIRSAQLLNPSINALTAAILSEFDLNLVNDGHVVRQWLIDYFSSERFGAMSKRSLLDAEHRKLVAARYRRDNEEFAGTYLSSESAKLFLDEIDISDGPIDSTVKLFCYEDIIGLLKSMPLLAPGVIQHPDDSGSRTAGSANPFRV